MAASGCADSLGAEPLARAIEAELAAQGLSARVSCPSDVAAHVGASIACTATPSADAAGPALVVRAQVLDDGQVALRPEAALTLGAAAPAIHAALARQGIDASHIDCGTTLVRAGESIACDIEAGDGRRLRWRAVLGADGRARGELVAR